MTTTVNNTTGVGAHYWTVTLTPPAQAPTALRDFIAMAQNAIQTAVDLLGRGAPELPPKVDDLMSPTIYQSLGTGSADKNYRAILAAVDQRRDSLLGTDQTVLQAAITVSARSDSTLQTVEGVVDQLQTELKSITGKLTAAQTAALMQQIGYAVDVVNAQVTSAYEANHSTAGSSSANGGGTGSGAGSCSSGSGSGSGSTSGSDGGGSVTPGQGSGSGSGSSGGGLGSLLELLPVVGMMALPMLAQVAQPVLQALGLGQHQDQQNHKQSGPQNGNAPAQQQGPAQQPSPTPQPATAAPAAAAPQTPQAPTSPPSPPPVQNPQSGTATQAADPPAVSAAPQQPPPASATPNSPATTPAAAH